MLLVDELEKALEGFCENGWCQLGLYCSFCKNGVNSGYISAFVRMVFCLSQWRIFLHNYSIYSAELFAVFQNIDVQMQTLFL